MALTRTELEANSLGLPKDASPCTCPSGDQSQLSRWPTRWACQRQWPTSPKKHRLQPGSHEPLPGPTPRTRQHQKGPLDRWETEAREWTRKTRAPSRPCPHATSHQASQRSPTDRSHSLHFTDGETDFIQVVQKRFQPETFGLQSQRLSQGHQQSQSQLAFPRSVLLSRPAVDEAPTTGVRCQKQSKPQPAGPL